MDSVKGQSAQKVLLVDDDEAVLAMMKESLESKGFKVAPAGSVREALKLITTEGFDVLITDLHLPNPGDGVAVVTAMRHTQPEALTLLISGYPDVKTAMDTVLLEADHVMVKPVEVASVTKLIHERALTRKPVTRSRKQRAGAILKDCMPIVVADWLARTKKSPELNHLNLSDSERTGHLAKLVEDLVVRLARSEVPSQDSDASFSGAAILHGKLRCLQGYTASMLVLESRILQVTIFGTLRNNLTTIDFDALLSDVMTIADEVDAQLTQTMTSFMEDWSPPVLSKPQVLLKPLVV
jgi:ActR/RegA family two-component response regulator